MLHKTIKSIVLGIIFVMLGMFILNALKSMKQEVAKVNTSQANKIEVSVKGLELCQESIEVSNYGTVQPRTILVINAELNGRLIYVAPQLLEGNAIRQNDVLIKIDPIDYQIAQDKAKASLEAQNVALEVLNREEENLQRTLQVLKRQLDIAAKELARYEVLLKEKSVSPSEFNKVDATYQTTLATTINTENALQLIPVKRKQIQTQIKLDTIIATQANVNMERTIIKAPFSGRVLRKYAENNQYVRTGDKLLEIYDDSLLEVKIPLSANELQWVIPEFYHSFIGNKPITTEHLAIKKHPVKIQLTHTQSTAVWNGDLVRLSSEVDSSTRTIGAIVEIKLGEGSTNNHPSQPPLLKGMFVKATFQNVEIKNIYKIPRNLIANDNTIFLFDQGKLRVKPIEILRIHNDYAYVSSQGIKSNDQLITSMLPIVVDGMEISISQVTANFDKKL